MLNRVMMCWFGFIMVLAVGLVATIWTYFFRRAIVDGEWMGVGLCLLFAPFVLFTAVVVVDELWYTARGEG